jgi:hypothetical protein
MWKVGIMIVLAENIGSPLGIRKFFKFAFQARIGPCREMDKIGLQTVCDIMEHSIQERKLLRNGVNFCTTSTLIKAVLVLESVAVFQKSILWNRRSTVR